MLCYVLVFCLCLAYCHVIRDVQFAGYDFGLVFGLVVQKKLCLVFATHLKGKFRGE